MRKVHTKSRLGCKECKHRHIKCDERQPACSRCVQTGRQCSYLRRVTTLPLLSPASSHSTGPATTIGSSPVEPLPIVEPLPVTLGLPILESSGDPSLQECYGLFHLGLLHHFQRDLSDQLISIHPRLEVILGMFVVEAITVPYLMDELLAYSAAHKSTLGEESHRLLTTEATRLQTRALICFNSNRREVTVDNCLPLFMFSILLSQHALFDLSSSSHEDFSTLLEGLTRCISLHRGINAISTSSQPRLQERLEHSVPLGCMFAANRTNNTSFGECAGLLQRLNSSGMGTSLINVNREAVEALQRLFDSQTHLSPSSGHYLSAVQEWLIGVSTEYVQCLNERRHEALVVLAYFGVLLHRAAKYWFVGNLGRRLVQLITHHLGPYWEDWLEWPNQVIEG